jgi:hypothetical protein
MECVICLEDIYCNDYCKFNCCNNSVHNTCLKSWVDKSIKKKNVAKCFICSQKNSAIENILTQHSCNANANAIASATEIMNNNNNNNYIIIDISANNIIQTQAQAYIEIRSFLILKLIYTTLAIAILFISFLYLTL